VEIAPGFTDADWKALDLTREDHLRAIEAFRLRIEERFLKPVRAIMSFSRSGFAVLALDSLLVETLQQFMKGVPETPQGDAAAGCLRRLRHRTEGTRFSALGAISPEDGMHRRQEPDAVAVERGRPTSRQTV
jgi:hypothetical protein